MQKYKNVLPCGILRVDDLVYWLLHPEPVEKDNWQRYEQQRFVVVPFRPEDVNQDGDLLYDYSRHLVCTNPTIEYRNVTEPIKVLWIDEEYNRIPEPEQFEPEPKDLEFARDLFLKEVGAIPEDNYTDENQRALELMQEGLPDG